MSWMHSFSDLEAAKTFYDREVYIAFDDLLNASDIARLRAAFRELEESGSVVVGEKEIPYIDDGLCGINDSMAPRFSLFSAY